MNKGMIEIKLDKAALARVQMMLREVPREMPGIISRSINQAAQSARTEITRRLAKEVNLPQNRIRQGIALHKATRKSWQAVINVFGKMIPLIFFAARRLKKGVSYQISKAEGRKQIKETPATVFIQTMPSGHKGVFRRVGTALWRGERAASQRRRLEMRYKGSHRIGRLPIIQLMGPSLGAIFEGAAGLARDVIAAGYKTLERNIDAQIKWVLGKLGSGRRAA
jgi:hypothetical protein